MKPYLANVLYAVAGVALGYVIMWRKHQRYRYQNKSILAGLQTVSALPVAVHQRDELIARLAALFMPMNTTEVEARVRDIMTDILGIPHAKVSEIVVRALGPAYPNFPRPLGVPLDDKLAEARRELHRTDAQEVHAVRLTADREDGGVRIVDSAPVEDLRLVAEPNEPSTCRACGNPMQLSAAGHFYICRTPKCPRSGFAVSRNP